MKKIVAINLVALTVLSFSGFGLYHQHINRTNTSSETPTYERYYTQTEVIKDEPILTPGPVEIPTTIDLDYQEPEEELPKANDFTEEDLELLAHLIMGEAGGVQNDEWLYYYGSVALNRVADKDFPNTLKEVIYQKEPCLQYACTVDGNFDKEPTDSCYEIAQDLLMFGSVIPSDVVWQSECEQGSGKWKQCGNTYFCYK